MLRTRSEIHYTVWAGLNSEGNRTDDLVHVLDFWDGVCDAL